MGAAKGEGGGGEEGGAGGGAGAGGGGGSTTGSVCVPASRKSSIVGSMMHEFDISPQVNSTLHNVWFYVCQCMV